MLNTLVHGDLHPGNVLGTSGRFVLLDWGDCGVGHPIQNQLTFCSHLGEADCFMVEAAWSERWGAGVPSCQVSRDSSQSS
jgi:aminoglycoside phosphotransferase (APT) family kinase protein